MSNLPATTALSEADYDAIEAAVMETVRGRWFLAEYARRNRQADTALLLAAFERVETAIRGERTVQPVDRFRLDLVEMAKSIARTKAEIATIKPDSGHHGKFGEATEELDSIVHATETATSDILAAAEQIQEIAWTLREQGVDADICGVLDTRATDIYTACSFQDLTGQRTSKVIKVLRYLESRINRMIDIWGLEDAMSAEATEAERAKSGEAALLNGPARPGLGLDQTDVDVVMGPVAVAPRPAASRDGEVDTDRIDTYIPATGAPGEPFAAEPFTAAPSVTPAQGSDMADWPAPLPGDAPDGVEAPAAEPDRAAGPAPESPASGPLRAEPVTGSAEPVPTPEAKARSAALASAALSRIDALTAEEKIALFS